MNNHPIDVRYKWKRTLLNRLLNGLQISRNHCFSQLPRCMCVQNSINCATLAHRAIKEIYDTIKLGQSYCQSVLELCVGRIPLVLWLTWNFEDIGNEKIASGEGVIKLNKKKISKWRKQ